MDEIAKIEMSTEKLSHLSDVKRICKDNNKYVKIIFLASTLQREMCVLVFMYLQVNLCLLDTITQRQTQIERN